MSDEQALACSDIFPTGYTGADLCGIINGVDVVAVRGCKPVGQMATKSAQLLGAAKVIAIENVPSRLDIAARESGALDEAPAAYQMFRAKNDDCLKIALTP